MLIWYLINKEIFLIIRITSLPDQGKRKISTIICILLADFISSCLVPFLNFCKKSVFHVDAFCIKQSYWHHIFYEEKCLLLHGNFDDEYKKQTLIKCQYLEKEDSTHAKTENHKEKSFLPHISNGKQANNNSLVSCVLSNF